MREPDLDLQSPPGDEVKLEGMPSQDGSYLMRITRAFREDGTEIGIPAGTNN